MVMDDVMHDIWATGPSAALLDGAGVSGCAVDVASSVGGVWPWDARATGKAIVLRCFEAFENSVLPSQPEDSPIRLALNKAHAPLENERGDP